MAIEFDAATQGAQDTTPVSHTVGFSGGGILIAGCAWDSGGTPRSITAFTYGGIALTALHTLTVDGDAGEQRDVAFYYLLAPASGANNLAVTFSGGLNHFVLACASYRGVNQASPFFGSPVTDAQIAVATLTCNVAAAAGMVCVDVMGQFSFGAGSAATVGAGQTQRNNQSAPAAGHSVGDGMSDEPGAASVAMTWSLTTAGARGGLIAAAMVPVAAGNQVILIA